MLDWYSDDLTVKHHLSPKQTYKVAGYQILNLHENTQKSEYFLRCALIPWSLDHYWTHDHVMQIACNDIDSWENGIPMALNDGTGRFRMVYPVITGQLGDGKELPFFLHKKSLSHSAGNHLLKESLPENPSTIGTEFSNCFTSGRFLTNSVRTFFIFH